MNKYELAVVVSAKIEDDARTDAIEKIKALIEKFKGVIENGNGTVDNVDFWGKRKLAYEIAKVNEGYYTLINFTANPELPKELDRVFGITDGIIRHIIVKEEQ